MKIANVTSDKRCTRCLAKLNRPRQIAPAHVLLGLCDECHMVQSRVPCERCGVQGAVHLWRTIPAWLCCGCNGQEDARIFGRDASKKIDLCR